MEAKNVNGIKKIQFEDFKIIGVLGTGKTYICSSGKVILVKNKNENLSENNEIAIKIVKKGEILKKKQINHARNEIDVLSVINFPFIPKLLGFGQNDRYLFIAMECIKGEDFFNYLRKKKRLHSFDVMLYSAQIVISFEYLHSNNIVFR